MRFIITAQPGKDSKQPGPDAPFDEKLFTDYMRFNEEMFKAGILVAAEGLNPNGQGARIEVTKGKRALVGRSVHRIQGPEWGVLHRGREIARRGRSVGPPLPERFGLRRRAGNPSIDGRGGRSAKSA